MRKERRMWGEPSGMMEPSDASAWSRRLVGETLLVPFPRLARVGLPVLLGAAIWSGFQPA